MATNEDEIGAGVSVEARLRAVEDELAILRILMTHPPGADTSDGEFWDYALAEDGSWDIGEQDADRHGGDLAGVIGRDELVAKASAPAKEFTALQASGLAHVSSAPAIDLQGDRASAWNYTQLLGLENGSFRVRRVVANRWDLRREEGRWRIVRRTARLLNGHPESLALLHGAVEAALQGRDSQA